MSLRVTIDADYNMVIKKQNTKSLFTLSIVNFFVDIDNYQLIVHNIGEQKIYFAELKAILSSPKFNPEKDLDILPKKKSEDPFDPYTTANTMLALDFDNYDVRDELLKIKAEDYAETIVDNKNASLPPFYVFYRDIKSKEVYIKVKIRDSITGKIFCVSFHFARYATPENLPYKT